MSVAKIDARMIEMSGRTLAEHEDIVRSLQTDPRGARSVRLDFESGDFSGWSVRRLAREYSAVIQGDIVRTGTKACRFEIRPGDNVSQGLRAELRDWYNAPFEEDVWYGFATYLPEGFQPPAGVGVVLAQWHDQAELGDPSGKPPLALRYLDGALRVTGAYSQVASHEPERRYVLHEIADVPRKTWLDFVFHVRWSRTGDSSVDGFLGREKIFSFEGPLGYQNQLKGPYFKLGVYASGEIDGPLVAYHDNYGRSDSFEAVDPSALPSPKGAR